MYLTFPAVCPGNIRTKSKGSSCDRTTEHSGAESHSSSLLQNVQCIAHQFIPTHPCETQVGLFSPERSTLPQTPSQAIEPVVLPEREQAIMLFNNEGDAFTAALASLARNADEVTATLLLEKYTAFEAREGFDNLRSHQSNNLALALIATRYKEAIHAVLKKALGTTFWGDSSPYTVQGILFKGSMRPLFWDNENPWHISTEQTVQEAIAHRFYAMCPVLPRF
jgi:hypothetical protein